MAEDTRKSVSSSAIHDHRAAIYPVLILLVGTALVLTLLAPVAWPTLILDGMYPLAVIAAATGWGAWPVRWLGYRAATPGKQVCLAGALGLGITGTATLVFGLFGMLSPVAAWCVLAPGALLGLLRLQLESRSSARSADSPAAVGSGRPAVRRHLAQGAILLPLAVPLGVMLFGALLPPGVLWRGEARGYDVLEYHLQVPREYFDAGRIEFLPHNVYASFPQQVEIHYLLLMHLIDDAHAAAIPAQLFHAMLGVLLVCALAAWSKPGWSRLATVVTAGTVPWLAYVGCLAYVELGMVFFAAVACGLLLDSLEDAGGYPTAEQSRARKEAGDRGVGPLAAQPLPHGRGSDRSRDSGMDSAVSRARKSPRLQPERSSGRSADTSAATSVPDRESHAFSCKLFLAAGLCAGLAGGCKYTALVLVALGLGVAYVTVTSVTRQFVWRRMIAYAFGVALAISPWLIRNAAFTGNPVFPFASKVFPSSQWTADQEAQWARGHHLPPEAAGVWGRVRTGWHELIGTHMFGPALFVLAVGGLIARRDRRAWMLKLWAALACIAWATMTHMPGRFAVPLVIPLSLLAGGLLDWTHRGQSLFDTGKTEPPRWLRLPVVLVVVIGALLNDSFLWRTLQAEQRSRSTGVSLEAFVDTTHEFVRGERTNVLTPPDGRVWLVGPAAVFYVVRDMHYSTVFNRDPWVEYAANGAPPAECLDWLRTRNVTHVVFSWAEIERLRKTYGFAEIVTHEWVAELEAVGLRLIERAALDDGMVVSETFAVTRE